MITLPVSIVVPVLNEAANLPALFTHLANQTCAAEQIIFVDSGSQDNSVPLIEAWAQTGLFKGQILLLENAGGFPGSSRNRGVEKASQPWIAFLDVGIEPNRDWLKNLFDWVTAHKTKLAFGQCLFEGTNTVSQAVCALSLGHATKRPVLPASLFHKEVFDRVGFFPEHLRAAEDLLWMARVKKEFGMPLCVQALVLYKGFPTTITHAVTKWHMYAKHTALAGLHKKQTAFYCLFYSCLVGLALTNPLAALILFLTYTLARGVALPLYKGHSVLRLLTKATMIPTLLLLGVLLDLAKFSGFVRGTFSCKFPLSNTHVSHGPSSIPTGRDTMSSGLHTASNYHAWMFDWIKPHIAGHVLDIGGGTGNHLKWLTNHPLCSIDISKDCVDFLTHEYSHLPNWSFVCADITNKTTPDLLGQRLFDTVLSCNVFEHIADDNAAFAVSASLLKEGGALVLLLPAHACLFGSMDKLAGHHRRYNKKMVVAKLKACGLVPERVHYVNILGALGWFVNNRLMRHKDLSSASINAQIHLFDKLAIPVLKCLERVLPLPFGQSLVCVGRKGKALT